ncbi:MAG: serine hydrolase [Flavobacteriaceae bacterium]|nr:serine hydrolase [Flavobacteriaceae bacterium]
MKTNNFMILIFVLALFLNACTTENQKTNNNDLIKKVETGLISNVYIEGGLAWSIEERMKHYGIPGISIAVINNGEIVWTKAYGIMDKESKAPVTKQTLFQAVSQPVSAYGALTLVEQNKVSLNKNINSYLKSWKVADNEFTKEKKVTLKNLLNHSAGINIHAIPGYSTDEDVPTLIEVLNGTPPSKKGPILLNKKPETNHYNSGGGFTIVQQMMIDVEGKKFPEIMNELVLQPLEMTNSTFNQPLTVEQLKVAATGYMADGSMVKGKSHTYPGMAANGLWTNAEDLAKFIINIQKTLKNNSNKGLSKDMTAEMLTKSPFIEDSYGLGTYVSNRNDETYFGQGSWNRGFYSYMTAHRDKGYGVVVLTNSTHPNFAFELIRSVALAYDWDDYVLKYKKEDVKFFLDGNFEQVLETYRNLMKQDPNNPVIRRSYLNRLGYHFLSSDQTNIAHDVFKVNTILYPENANVYDSYAEICMTLGKIDLAILNYSKSLELNPQNDNAKDMLKELQKSK